MAVAAWLVLNYCAPLLTVTKIPALKQPTETHHILQCRPVYQPLPRPIPETSTVEGTSLGTLLFSASIFKEERRELKAW